MALHGGNWVQIRGNAHAVLAQIRRDTHMHSCLSTGMACKALRETTANSLPLCLFKMPSKKSHDIFINSCFFCKRCPTISDLTNMQQTCTCHIIIVHALPLLIRFYNNYRVQWSIVIYRFNT